MTNIQQLFDTLHDKIAIDVFARIEGKQLEDSYHPFFFMILNYKRFIKHFGIDLKVNLGEGNLDYVFDKNFNYIEEDYKKVRDEMKNMLETQTPKDRDKAVHAFEEFNNAYNSLCEVFGFERDTSND